MPLQCPKTLSTIAVTRSSFLIIQGNVCATLNITQDVLIYLGIVLRRPALLAVANKYIASLFAPDHYHRGATTSTAFKLLGLGISVHSLLSNPPPFAPFAL
jgi:hypothetical protein